VLLKIVERLYSRQPRVLGWAMLIAVLALLIFTGYLSVVLVNSRARFAQDQHDEGVAADRLEAQGKRIEALDARETTATSANVRRVCWAGVVLADLTLAGLYIATRF
jgi:hypothetical protein